ncbi:hypothetical protein UFOVP330_49 [uncultured Caudovirales phage]|uniref:Uncharacterized protein n=1 Tax=uncultured Caudovirales phage TaxID=2100421 RepID=A0A6J5LWG4_9CAUD|nr:hypothetical protein UFOVP330_49 [uncultured Caudovirales phage]
MSQISLSPNAAGTAIFTVAAPGTSTNRTLTLPDATGTVLSTADLATQAEAQAGSDNTKLMTPLRVSEAIASDLASQAEAEAGTDNTKLMTPLRAAQAISALSTVFLGTITTTSGTTQTLSGLDLTPYRFLLAFINAVSAGTTTNLLFAGVDTGKVITTTQSATGMILVELASGIAAANVGGVGTANTSAFISINTAVFNATTSVSVSAASAFDAGSVRIYGMR